MRLKFLKFKLVVIWILGLLSSFSGITLDNPLALFSVLIQLCFFVSIIDMRDNSISMWRSKVK